jgi:CelD/BcsL family acetyltransferase involved in cellulose biosynthesis
MSDLLVAGCDAQARLCQNLQDAPLGRVAWNRLLQKSETKSIFLTWQWLSSWWEAFREGADLYAFAVERDNDLIGIAPLVLRRHDGVRTVEFLGMGSSDYADFIASEDDKPDVIRAVFDALMKRRDRWDRIRLRYLPEKSSTAKLLSGIVLPPSWEFRREVEAVCPALSVEASPSFAEACTRKKSLVRHARYFERLGPLEFYHAMDVDEILDRLPDFYEQHRDRRFLAGDQSLFDDPRHRRFYERMIPALIEAGTLRFSVLRWKDEILAYHLGFLHDGTFTWYKPTFNVDYAKYSPGEVLLQKLLESALAENVRLFDFTVGDEAFKERFANVKNANLAIEIGPRRAVPLGERARAHAKRYVKARHPRLFATLKSRAEAAERGDVPEHLSQVVTTRPVGSRRLPIAPPTSGVVSQVLWRAAPMQPVPSEFGAQWAKYSHLKLITRREGLQPAFLHACIEKLHRGERAVVAIWAERPVALAWLAPDGAAVVRAAGFDAAQIPAGAAVLTDSYLALDLRGSPRRETLPPALLTFLAAEGVTALYGVQDTRLPAPAIAQCGARLIPMARRLVVPFWRWRMESHKRFDAA